jgi:hypothetical protein
MLFLDLPQNLTRLRYYRRDQLLFFLATQGSYCCLCGKSASHPNTAAANLDTVAANLDRSHVVPRDVGSATQSSNNRPARRCWYPIPEKSSQLVGHEFRKYTHWNPEHPCSKFPHHRTFDSYGATARPRAADSCRRPLPPGRAPIPPTEPHPCSHTGLSVHLSFAPPHWSNAPHATHHRRPPSDNLPCVATWCYKLRGPRLGRRPPRRRRPRFRGLRLCQ